MKHKSYSSHPFWATLLIAILLCSCSFLPDDTGGDQIKPKQTRILDVRVLPDTVAPGDTARFVCIIEDSLDERFKFYWYIDEGEVLNAELFDDIPITYITEVKNVQWIAPNEAGFHSFTVLTANGSKDSVSVSESFLIIVK